MALKLHGRSVEVTETHNFGERSMFLALFEKIITEKNPILRRATKYISSNIKRDISIKEISLATKVSQAYIIFLFRNRFNMTPYQYILAVRIMRAVSIIESDPLVPLTRICWEVGFKTVAQFKRKFSEFVGVRPESYQVMIDSFVNLEEYGGSAATVQKSF